MSFLSSSLATMVEMVSSSRKAKFAGVLLLLLAARLAHAQGGPPFRTDDPDTPGNRHWEINFGFIGQRNPGAGAYQVPDIDMNYGLGDRIQLKYEIPLALEETVAQPATPGQAAVSGTVLGGVGGSYPGIKWRFYEHHPGDRLFRNRFGTGLLELIHHRAESQSQPPDAATPQGAAAPAEEPQTNFSISTYPQLLLNNPGRSVLRGVVATGPDFLLPIEFNARVGPLRIDGEGGYFFGNQSTPQSWIRGLLVGHEFSDRTEAYAEIYDQQDANRVSAGRGVGAFATGLPKQRQTTIGGGGRQALNKDKTLLFMFMGGRSYQTISADNSQPSWIAYMGLQVLFGPK
jgi:hypothetical protein